MMRLISCHFIEFTVNETKKAVSRLTWKWVELAIRHYSNLVVMLDEQHGKKKKKWLCT